VTSRKRLAAFTLITFFVAALFAGPVHLLAEAHPIEPEHDHHHSPDHSLLDHASPDAMISSARADVVAEPDSCVGFADAPPVVVAAHPTSSVESPPPRPPGATPACPRAPPVA